MSVRRVWLGEKSRLSALIVVLLAITASVIAAEQRTLRPRIATAQNPDTGTPEIPLGIQITEPTSNPTLTVAAETLVVKGFARGAGALSLSVSCTGCQIEGSSDFTPTELVWTRTFQLTCSVGGSLNTINASVLDELIRFASTSLQVTCVTGDAAAPTVTITTDGGSGFGADFTKATTGPVSLAGTAVDTQTPISRMWWETRPTNCSSGTMLDTGPVTYAPLQTLSVTWNTSVDLVPGANVICIFATDSGNPTANTASDSITVTYSQPLAITTTSGGSCVAGSARTFTVGAAQGGTGTYTWDNNGAGTTLDDADADCAGTSISSAGVVSCTTATAAGTCSWTARVNDGSTTATKALTTTITAEGSTFFATINALSEAQSFSGCTGTDAKGCSWTTTSQVTSYTDKGTMGEYTIDSSTFGTPTLKLTWPQEQASLGENLRVPIQQGTAGDSILLIWDVYYDHSWTKSSCGGVIPESRNNDYKHKEFQHAMGPSLGSGRIFHEIRQMFGKVDALTCDDIAFIGLRSYPNGPQTDAQLAILNNTNFNAGADHSTGQGTPAYETIPIKHGKWVRYWSLIKLRMPHTAFTSWNAKYGITVPFGYYHMASLWVADENRDPQRVFFEAPIRLSIGGNVKNVTSFTCSANTASVTFDENHTVSTGETVTFIGADQTEFNNTFVVATTPTSTSITFPVGSCPVATATGTIRGGKANTWLNKFWYEHNTSASHEQARGKAVFTGTAGTSVPKATFVDRADGTRFKTDKAAAIGADGSVLIDIFADGGGPGGNTDGGTILTLEKTIAGINPTATVDENGLKGGAYLLDGDLIAWFRWFSVLKNYSLTLGDTSAEDVANNPVIFQRPR